MATEHNRPVFVLCLLMILATLAINLLSSYIRHTEAGLGCTPWPDCYAVVGALEAPRTSGEIASEALTPTDRAKQMHRGIATGLVILIAVVVYQARQLLQPARGFVTYLPYLIVLVILVLAIVGPASYLKTLPAVATVNILGGMCLLLLGWWLWIAIRFGPAPANAPSLARPANWAVTALLMQILLGAWMSANFAGAACTGLLRCNADSSGGSAWSALWYFRELDVDASGRIVMGSVQAAIHSSHRIGAVIAAALLIYLCIRCWQHAVLRPWLGALLCLLLLQLSLGISAVWLQLPLAVVLAHNLCASLLLLCAVRIRLAVR